MYDLVVIGGGAGGLHVAKAAARVGARVALIDKDRPGAAGSFAACVPSKGLAQAAKLAGQFRGAARFGLRAGTLDVDFAALMAHVRAIAEDLASRDSAAALEKLGIDLFEGSAAFEAYDTLTVSGSRSLSAHRFVIATGSRPAVPELPGLAEAGYLDEQSLLSLASRPAHLIILGSETVAIEFAQAFARLGSKVTVLSPSPVILSSYETQVSDFVQRSLSRDGVSFELGVDVTKVEARGGETSYQPEAPAKDPTVTGSGGGTSYQPEAPARDLSVTARGGEIVCKFTQRSTGLAGEASGSHLLLAAERLANVEDLKLEVVGVHGDARHGIEVDECLQTHSARIYAIGDVLLRHPYANAAEREAEVAFQNAVLRLKKKIDYSILPRAAFVDPEVASVGVTEEKARGEELPHRVYRVDFSAVDRARIDGRGDGFAKVVVTPGGKVLGATVVGEDACMILQEFVLAIEKGLSLRDLAAATPIYPTYAAVARQLAEQHLATRRESGFLGKALRLFYGFAPRVATDNGAAAQPPEAPTPADVHAH
jgi:pyruvate/2-oxoglutarate dehydrogenase complex dihydrolipoamide dehydrogenase (E3) component